MSEHPDGVKEIFQAEVLDALGKFESTRDPLWLLETLRRAIQYSDVRADYPEVWALLTDARERWGSGLADPTNPASAWVKTLGQAFGIREPRGTARKSHWTPQAHDLRVEGAYGQSLCDAAWREVERLHKRGYRVDRSIKPNAFGEAAKVLPRLKGRKMGEVTVERCWLAARKALGMTKARKSTHEKALS